ncbi:MAG: hypothetical protein USCAAHI_01789 [Beijerinckiaceae bacterium]|nr:MAG: hypothetical protein USCAAHI_01789 [Beijerinckiaceae bacterium]
MTPLEEANGTAPMKADAEKLLDVIADLNSRLLAVEEKLRQLEADAAFRASLGHYLSCDVRH